MEMRLPIISCLALICAMCLQGCSITVPRHQVGNWEANPSYLGVFKYKLKEMPDSYNSTEKHGILNSCSDPNIAKGMACSGHGHCKDWNDLKIGESPAINRLSFCECDEWWADPECRTPRKSQLTAFVLSLTLGMFGVDAWYLGYTVYGFMKLFTLGGCGILWLYDICKIGSHPTSTFKSYRVGGDLPHYAFVLTVLTTALLVGFAVAIKSIQRQRVKRSHELLLLRLEEQKEEEEEYKAEAVNEAKGGQPCGPPYSMTAPQMQPSMPLKSGGFSGYGSVLPRAGAAPMSMPMSMPVAQTLPPRSFMPAATVSAPVATTLLPVPSMLPQRMVSQTSMPPTEYSLPRNSSPVLPVVQGLAPASAPFMTNSPRNIRPVSSTVL